MGELIKHTEKVDLIHIAFETYVESIKKNGIRASAYGDLEVNGIDGYGVYAVKDVGKHQELIEELSFCGEALYSVIFAAPGEWYECVSETKPEDYDDDDSFVPIHIGYVVLPYNIEKQYIKEIRKLSS